MALYLVESLVRQCQHYIAMHAEDFPINSLCLLPLSTRKDLLYQLPITDICLRLENSMFIKGLDMEAFWRSTWEEEFFSTATSWDDNAVQSYVETWDGTQYARGVVYGLVATCAMGHLHGGEYWFHSPLYNRDSDGEAESGMHIFQFLYAVRKPSRIPAHNGCELKYPPRYSHKSNKQDRDLVMYEVVNCFSHGKNEFPKIFPEIEILNDIHLDHVYFLRDAVYVGIKGHLLDEGLEFLKAAIKEATKLEVLLLDHWYDNDQWETRFLDDFCCFLSSCQISLSNFQVFKVLSSMCRGLVISRKNFNQLITAYFAAPTNHVQKLEFNMTKIHCNDISFECIPQLDQCYLPFKTIQLNQCQFVSEYKPTAGCLSHWLGQDIFVLEHESKDVDSCYFKVQNKTGE